MHIKEYLKNNILITDGAMGTYYSQMNHITETISERANLNDKETIEKIHLEYIEAGARLIRTNTFAVNKWSLEEPNKEIRIKYLQEGFQIAQNAVKKSGKEVFIAADIGPIPVNAFSDEDEIIDEYKLICDTFIKLGAEIILFETFSDIGFIKALAAYIKGKSNIYVMAQVALNRFGYTRSGVGAKRLIKDLNQIDEIDAFGFNCGIGSGDLYKILKKIELPIDKPIIGIPNSGYPEILQERVHYLDNVEYFADRMEKIAGLGIKIIGGCCGTTPKYIERITTTKKIKSVPMRRILLKDHSAVDEYVQENPFYQKLKQNKKVIAVELDPPFDTKVNKLIEGANLLKASSVDLITVADSPLGKPRADSIMIGSLIQRDVQIAAMPHVCCRDKNLIGLRAGILSGYIHGIRNFLFVTGDPIPSSDRDETTSVFDVNSIQLMNLVSQMNREHFSKDPIYFGGALNPDRIRIDREIERMKRKIDAGAKFFLTQPIYDEAVIEKVRTIKSQLDTKIICGILPLVSYRNAVFIQNEIGGINIPEHIINKYHENMTREEAQDLGIHISVEIAKCMADVTDGYYFMTPFNRAAMVVEIITKLKHIGCV